MLNFIKDFGSILFKVPLELQDYYQKNGDYMGE